MVENHFHEFDPTVDEIVEVFDEDNGYEYYKVMDTSAANARQGRDIQGIPWERLIITKENYRLSRLKTYTNYENIENSWQAVKECKSIDNGAKYYDFFYTRAVTPKFMHFQLRNLVWATSKHDVYFISGYEAMHWSSVTRTLTEVVSFFEPVGPEVYEGIFLEGFTETQISTFAVKDNFMVAGGFMGELVGKRLDKRGGDFCTRSTYEDNGIVNALEIYDTLSGGHHFMASNNDCGIREYEMERFQLLSHFHFPWAVNHTSISPDRKLAVVVGDHMDGLVIDSQTGQVVSTTKGHRDYSFASAWHPDGRIFATGNQDRTSRVWDVRNVSKPIAILKCIMDAARSIRFSSDGHFMVVAEGADYVHIYNTKENYDKEQEIGFFGEIAGVSLSPDDESLYIGVVDRRYSGLLQYNRRHRYKYLDSFA